MTTLNTIIEEEKKKIESYDADVIEEEGEASYLVYHIPERDLNSILTSAMQRAYEAGRADWLRSEIEKLEGMKLENYSNDGYLDTKEEIYADKIKNQALTSIITRYKEELLELENGK